MQWILPVFTAYNEYTHRIMVWVLFFYLPILTNSVGFFLEPIWLLTGNHSYRIWNNWNWYGLEHEKNYSLHQPIEKLRNIPQVYDFNFLVRVASMQSNTRKKYIKEKQQSNEWPSLPRYTTSVEDNIYIIFTNAIFCHINSTTRLELEQFKTIRTSIQ